MTPISSAAVQAPAPLPLFSQSARPDTATSLIRAATALMETLAKGQQLDARALRAAMEAAFGGSEAAGAWYWKLAYEACEAAQLLFLRKFGAAMRARAGSPAIFLLEPHEAVAPDGHFRREIGAGDGDEASAIRKAGQRRRDMPERGVGDAAFGARPHPCSRRRSTAPSMPATAPMSPPA